MILILLKAPEQSACLPSELLLRWNNILFQGHPLPRRIHQGKHDKAIIYLTDAINLLDNKLETLSVMDLSYEDMDDNISRSSHDSKFSTSTRTTAPTQRGRRQVLQLLEDKSIFYSCLANIYRDMGMNREAMDNYVSAMNMIVEANYPGDSPRVVMIMRIMKRAETNRRGL